jgi:AmiR/NasT family two-component response regulator
VLRSGHIVCARADNSPDFATQIRLHHPDLIIVQEFLPGLENLCDVTQAAGIPIPAIVVLDRNDGSLPERFDSADVLAVLQEPIRDSDLIPLIPLVMDRSNERRALREAIDLLKTEIGRQPSSHPRQ